MKPMIEMIVDEPMTSEELAAFHQQRQQFETNAAWFAARAVEIGQQYAGQFICIAGQELFVGREPREVFQRARQAHPEDKGIFFKSIRATKGPMIYGHTWRMVSM